MNLIRLASPAAVAATLLACIPSSDLPPGEEVAREASALTANTLLRGEIKRAFESQAQPQIRLLPEDAWMRIAGAVGHSVEPEEVRDIEEFFQRLMFEDYRAFNIRGPNPTLVGSVTSVAGTGQPHASVAKGFAPQTGALPAPGEPLSVEVLADALREMGCDTLRPEILLYAAHQREVATNNNAFLRNLPVGTKLDGIKGMTLVPTWIDSFTNQPTGVAVKESSWMVHHAIDLPYRSSRPPKGSRFELGEIGEINVVTAAELGSYVELPGVRRLLPYGDVLAATNVLSPPIAVWNEMLNPGRDLGQRMRILSAILDRIDEDGQLSFTQVVRTAKPTRRTYHLSQSSFESSLAHWLYHGFDEGGFGEIMGWLFVDAPDGCGAENAEPCVTLLDVLLDRRTQQPLDWTVPSLNILDRLGNPVYLRYGHVETFEEASTSILFQQTAAEHYDAKAHNTIPAEERPLELAMPPLERAVNTDPKLTQLAEFEGRIFALYEGALFRNGGNVTPLELSLSGVSAFAGKTLLRIDDRVFFLNHWNGILAYDLREDLWFRSETTAIMTFWAGAAFNGETVSGVYQGQAQSVNLATLEFAPLGLARPPSHAEPDCAHSPLRVGGPLVRSCAPCVRAVVDDDPYCTRYAWDELCVEALDRCEP